LKIKEKYGEFSKRAAWASKKSRGRRISDIDDYKAE